MTVRLVLDDGKDGKEVELNEVYSINQGFERIYFHYYDTVKKESEYSVRYTRNLETLNISMSQIVDMIVDLV